MLGKQLHKLCSSTASGQYKYAGLQVFQIDKYIAEKGLGVQGHSPAKSRAQLLGAVGSSQVTKNYGEWFNGIHKNTKTTRLVPQIKNFR